MIREGGVAAGVRALVPTAARSLGPQTECNHCEKFFKNVTIMKTISLLSQFRACRPNTNPLRIRQIPSSRPQLRYNRPQGQQRRQGYVRAEDPNFVSVVDHPPRLVRAGRRHGPGLIVLGLYISLSRLPFSFPLLSV